MTSAPSSLVDRAGLDRQRLAKIISRGLEGADDGELFLEYRQAEMLVFDNGRLKQATYDTSQGSACAPSRTRRSATPMHRTFPRRRSHAPLMPFVRSRAAIRAPMPPRRRAPTSNFMARIARWAAPHSKPRPGCLKAIDAYARAKDPRVRQVSVSLGATWQAVEVVRSDGETYRDVRPLVRVNVSVVVGDGDRQETGSAGYGGREGYERFIITETWQARSTRRCARR